jgi:hypothetical protein
MRKVTLAVLAATLAGTIAVANSTPFFQIPQREATKPVPIPKSKRISIPGSKTFEATSSEAAVRAVLDWMTDASQKGKIDVDMVSVQRRPASEQWRALVFYTTEGEGLDLLRELDIDDILRTPRGAQDDIDDGIVRPRRIIR